MNGNLNYKLYINNIEGKNGIGVSCFGGIISKPEIKDRKQESKGDYLTLYLNPYNVVRENKDKYVLEPRLDYPSIIELYLNTFKGKAFDYEFELVKEPIDKASELFKTGIKSKEEYTYYKINYDLSSSEYRDNRNNLFFLRNTEYSCNKFIFNFLGYFFKHCKEEITHEYFWDYFQLASFIQLFTIGYSTSEYNFFNRRLYKNIVNNNEVKNESYYKFYHYKDYNEFWSEAKERNYDTIDGFIGRNQKETKLPNSVIGSLGFILTTFQNCYQYDKFESLNYHKDLVRAIKNLLVKYKRNFK